MLFLFVITDGVCYVVKRGFWGCYLSLRCSGFCRCCFVRGDGIEGIRCEEFPDRRLEHIRDKGELPEVGSIDHVGAFPAGDGGQTDAETAGKLRLIDSQPSPIVTESLDKGFHVVHG